MTSHIKDILKKIGETEPKISKALKDEKAIKLWREAVDKRILKQTEPQGIKRKVLHVLTSTSLWAHELTLLRNKILERINSFAGGDIIKDIRFRVGRIESKEGGKRDQGAKAKQPQQKCKKCGVQHSWGGDVCPVCLVYASNERKKKIEKVFSEKPDADFLETQRRIPNLGRDEFEMAKRQARALILDRLRLIGREAQKKQRPAIIEKLKKESARYIQAFGGSEEALLREALGAEAGKASRIRSKMR